MKNQFQKIHLKSLGPNLKIIYIYMQPYFDWFSHSSSFWLKSNFEWNISPSLWSQIKGIIIDFDEFINTHARSRMHRLILCISIKDLVKPLHKNPFEKKNLLLLTCSIYYISKRKICFDLLMMILKFFLVLV